MLLYLDQTQLTSHQLRMVVGLKDIEVEIIEIDAQNPPEALEEISPDGKPPILFDQSVGIHDEFIIMEYLDERFPHPNIMPSDPMSRAIKRRMILEFKEQWRPHLDVLEKQNSPAKKIKDAQQGIKNKILGLESIIHNDYLVDSETDIVDIVMMSVLWRLKSYKIKLPEKSIKIRKYAGKIFKQPFFRKTLIGSEAIMMFKEKDKYILLNSEQRFNSAVDHVIETM